MFKRHYLQNGKHFLEFLFHFWNLHKILRILKKKDQLYSLNILEIIQYQKCRYLNAWKLQF